MSKTWVTYKNRSLSSNYKFSTTDRFGKEAMELKDLIKRDNAYLRELFEGYGWANKYAPYKDRWGAMAQPRNTPHYYRIKRIRFMGRGKRSMFSGQRHRAQYWAYLPYAYATHFDVYIANQY